MDTNAAQLLKRLRFGYYTIKKRTTFFTMGRENLRRNESLKKASNVRRNNEEQEQEKKKKKRKRKTEKRENQRKIDSKKEKNTINTHTHTQKKKHTRK